MSITVTTAIPSGNAALINVTETSGKTRVQFTADPCGGPEALWFCLRLEAQGDAAASTIELELTHVENLLGAGPAENIRPVIRYGNGAWARLGPPETRALPDGRRTYCWQIQRPDTFADVALCYPYGAAEVETLAQDLGDKWRGDVIGLSQGSRPMVRLSNDYGQADGDRPGLYLVARQHSGETPGSWVLDGMLRRFAELGDEAPLVWAVPLSNIDGVEQGAYGKDNFPYDLNRAWGRPAMRHETLVIQRDLKRWSSRCRPMLALDLHAPGGGEQAGVYAFVPKDAEVEVAARIDQWAAQMSNTLGPRYVLEQFGRIATYASRWDTPNFATHCAHSFKLPALSMEFTYALAGELVMEIDHYRDVGRLLADAIVQGQTADV